MAWWVGGSIVTTRRQHQCFVELGWVGIGGVSSGLGCARKTDVPNRYSICGLFLRMM